MKYKSELLWLILTIISAIIIHSVYSLFALDELDINQHDSYYLLGKPTLITSVIRLIFVVYLVRAVITRFGNPWVLAILFLSSLYLLITLYNFTIDYNTLKHSNQTSGLVQFDDNKFYPVVIGKQIALVILIGFTGIMFWQNLRKRGNSVHI